MKSFGPSYQAEVSRVIPNEEVAARCAVVDGLGKEDGAKAVLCDREKETVPNEIGNARPLPRMSVIASRLPVGENEG